MSLYLHHTAISREETLTNTAISREETLTNALVKITNPILCDVKMTPFLKVV